MIFKRDVNLLFDFFEGESNRIESNRISLMECCPFDDSNLFSGSCLGDVVDQRSDEEAVASAAVRVAEDVGSKMIIVYTGRLIFEIIFLSCLNYRPVKCRFIR